MLRWLLRRLPGVSDAARRTVQQWTFEDPRLVAKFYPYRPDDRSYLLPKAVPRPAGAALPIPPRDLWLGYADSPEEYLESGERRVRLMKQVVAASNFSIEDGVRLLDFGCASGIMLRWFERVAVTGEAWGVDIAGSAMQWCQQFLSPPFKFATTSSFPHLPFEDRYFGFIYAGSVFTHIADLAETWLLELRRILAPGGILFLTIHDNDFIDSVLAAPSPRRQMLADMLRTYDRESHFTTSGFSMFAINRIPGPGMQGQAQVFYDADYIRRHWGNYFSVLSIVPNALQGLQAGVVLRKP